ncbi:MAG: hypothetical protein CMG77_15560 [Marinimicrobium sp.]|nr:hypothetical protein [Marinimicrobium sp.]
MATQRVAQATVISQRSSSPERDLPDLKGEDPACATEATLGSVSYRLHLVEWGDAITQQFK